MSLLDQVRARIADHMKEREGRQTDLDALIADVEKRGDADLTEDETKKLGEIRADIKAIDEKIAAATTRESELKADDEARTAAAAVIITPPAPGNVADPVRGGAVVRSERRVYDGQPGLYLRDVMRTNPIFGQVDSSSPALQRLARHEQEIRVDYGAKLAAEARALDSLDAETRASVGRSTDAEVGYLVPPLYAVSDMALVARAGRPFADALGPLDLPGGVDSVKIPRFTTGTLTAVQNGDNAALTTQAVVTAETTASLVTIGGYIDVAVQALDTAPVDVQNILFGDLMADQAKQEDTLLWSGSGASGQPLGVFNIPGINTETYTDATPTPAELYPKLGEAVSKIHANRYLPAEVVFMHPTRWAWLTSVIASDGRPFAGMNATAMNTGIIADRVVAEGRAGSVMNLPVVLDANIPTNLGTGTNEDRIIAARISDARLWEGSLRMQALPVVDATTETLTVRLKLWRYCIFLGGRYPASWTLASGTGLATPTF